MANIGLIFPPQWCPTHPYLSLPSLSAYLRERGYSVFQKDLNIEYYTHILTDDYIATIGIELERRLHEMESGKFLRVANQGRYQDYFRAACIYQIIKGRTAKALGGLREKDKFFDFPQFKKNLTLIDNALKFISSLYYPTRISLTDYQTGYSPFKIKDILQAIRDNETNPISPAIPSLLGGWMKEVDPFCVGISITGSSQIIPAFTIGAWIKKNYPATHIVVGGSIVSRWREDAAKLMELSGVCFDSAIVYEGEQPMVDLVESLIKGKPLSEVQNLIFKDDTGKTTSNAIAEPVDINNLPTPDFDSLPFNKYFSPALVLPLLTSRGCYWKKCAFCDHSYVYHDRYAVRQSEKLTEDLKTLTGKYKTKYIAFSDEDVSPATFRKLAESTEKTAIDISYVAAARFESQFQDLEFCKRLAASGLRALYLGFESGSQKVLDDMDKGQTPEVVSKVCHTLTLSNIWPHLFVIIGFPTEKQKDFLETIKFIEDNKDNIGSVGFSSFTLCRYSHVSQNHKEFEVKLRNKQYDLPIYYDYLHYRGGGDEMDQRLGYFEEILTDLFPARKFWGSLERAHLLLYLDQNSIPEVSSFEEIDQRDSVYDGSTSYKVGDAAIFRKTPFDVTAKEFDRDLKAGEYYIIADPNSGVLFQAPKWLFGILFEFKNQVIPGANLHARFLKALSGQGGNSTSVVEKTFNFLLQAKILEICT